MQVIKHPSAIHKFSADQRKGGKSIGLVPTMGALHKGHFSLVKEAISQNDATVVSIFVNPLQFNNQSDLINYPRTLENDLAQLKEIGVEAVFLPDNEDMYAQIPLVKLDFGEMGKVMEGAFRPGHFDGVGVVVSKLFHMVNPDHAYFGLKDLQQFLLIKRMAVDLSFPIEIHGMDTVREPSGLAMSSRNMRLTAQGKEIAKNIFTGLSIARDKWLDRASPDETLSAVMSFYSHIVGLSVEYISIVDPDTLKDLDLHQESVAICVAGYVEGVRLIDNIYLR